MKKIRFQILVMLIASLLKFSSMNAQDNSTSKILDAKQRSLVSISALTAKGDIANLKVALGEGLDAGLTLNETKEALAQLYAYCGFPRSLNGITALMAVVEERKAKGIIDAEGKNASPIFDTTSKYEKGKKTLQILTGKEETGPKTGANAFVPIIDTFLKEHLFADIFSRDVLNYIQRELVTISALISMIGVEAQLQAHITIGLNVGITTSQVHEMLIIIKQKIGEKEAEIGKDVLLKVIALKEQAK